MSDLINLTKDVGIVLEKRKIDIIQCQVALNIDVSGSMTSIFNSSNINDIFSKLFAVAWVFDDNKQLESWAFSTRSYELPAVTEKNVDNYVKKNIINNKTINWSSTRYTPVVKDTVNYFYGSIERPTTSDNRNFFEKLFFNKPKTEIVTPQQVDPVFLLFITDGMPDDSEQFIEYIKSIQNKNIFIQAIGLGSTKFTVLEDIRNKTDNFDFYQVRDITTTPTMDLYEAIIGEKFINWYKKQFAI